MSGYLAGYLAVWSETNPRDELGIVLGCGCTLRAIIDAAVNRMTNCGHDVHAKNDMQALQSN